MSTSTSTGTSCGRCQRPLWRLYSRPALTASDGSSGYYTVGLQVLSIRAEGHASHIYPLRGSAMAFRYLSTCQGSIDLQTRPVAILHLVGFVNFTPDNGIMADQGVTSSSDALARQCLQRGDWQRNGAIPCVGNPSRPPAYNVYQGLPAWRRRGRRGMQTASGADRYPSLSLFPVVIPCFSQHVAS